MNAIELNAAERGMVFYTCGNGAKWCRACGVPRFCAGWGAEPLRDVDDALWALSLSAVPAEDGDGAAEALSCPAHGRARQSSLRWLKEQDRSRAIPGAVWLTMVSLRGSWSTVIPIIFSIAAMSSRILDSFCRCSAI
jgi:hypothetical protein